MVIPILLGMTLQRSEPRAIMARMVDPAANFIWRSVSITVTTEGIEETVPQNEHEWNEVRKAADRLAEGGRLLKTDPRRKDDSEWLKWSQAIIDSATLTREAVQSKNPDGILEAGDAIYNTCVGCHGGYWRMSSP